MRVEEDCDEIVARRPLVLLCLSNLRDQDHIGKESETAMSLPKSAAFDVHPMEESAMLNDGAMWLHQIDGELSRGRLELPSLLFDFQVSYSPR